MIILAATLLFSPLAFAQACLSGDDDPALKVKAAHGVTLVVCGFEDREVKSPKGKRAFADFTIYALIPNVKEPQKVFASGASETFWIKANEGQGFELEELWFFSEEPKPALWQEISCEASGCKVSSGKCVFKMKPNSFPRAIKSFEKLRSSAKLEEEGEELLDQVWAQALTGDPKAQKFYDGKLEGVSPSLIEVFTSNKAKLKELTDLKCK